MFFDQPAQSISASVLLDGVIGASAGAVVSVIAALWLDRRNKVWTLQAELRRFRVDRVAKAVEGLRQGFYGARTQVLYHLLALEGLENKANAAAVAPTPPPGQSVVDPVLLRQSFDLRAEVRAALAEEIRHYNDRVGQLEAAARSNAALLSVEFLPQELTTRVARELAILSVTVTSSVANIKGRLAMFDDHEQTVISTLAECDKLIAAEISKHLES